MVHGKWYMVYTFSIHLVRKIEDKFEYRYVHYIFTHINIHIHGIYDQL